MSTISDERLAEIVDGFTGLEVCAPADRLSPEETLALATELQSLRAQGGVRVKQLVWKENGVTSLWTGELAFGVYYTACDEGSGWRVFRGQFLSEAGDDEIAYGTKSSVLAAAQADYERRILSSLEASPAPVSEEEVLAGEILAELVRARTKFPGKNVTFAALIEEVGELATATFEEGRDRVRKEAVQVAVMAMRMVLDGDHTFDQWREEKGLDALAAKGGQ